MEWKKLVGFMKDKLKQWDAGTRPFCTAVVPAAGNSTRMAGQDKQFCKLLGVPVLMRTLLQLEACENVDEIIVATRPEEIERVMSLAQEYSVTKLARVVPGGCSRGESVAKGAAACSKKTKLIAVHDGARPLGSSEMIGRVIALAARTDAAVAVVPVKDTIKLMAEDGAIDHTPDRAKLRAAQTPQVFDADLLRAAYAKAAETGVDYTDDCAAVEALGKRIYTCEGENCNIKITTPEDLILAAAVLEAQHG